MVRKLLPSSFAYVTNLTMTSNYKAVKTGVKALVQNVTNNNNFRILAHIEMQAADPRQRVMLHAYLSEISNTGEQP